MNKLTAFNIAVGIGAYIALAALAPPAQANDADNPFLPKPAASSETFDHGQGSYCSKPFLLGTCEAPKLTGGGPGNTDNNAATLTPTPPAAPNPPACDHGEKSKV